MSLGCRLRPGSSIFFYQEPVPGLKINFLVQSGTKARLFTGKATVFINIFVSESSVSLLNISLQFLTGSATSVTFVWYTIEWSGPKSLGHTRDVTLIAQNLCAVLLFQLYFEQLCKVKNVKGKYQNSPDFEIKTTCKISFHMHFKEMSVIASKSTLLMLAFSKFVLVLILS